MGRLIDADLLREEVNSWGMNDYEPSDFTDAIDDAPTVEAIPKADYEARLRAEKIAMLKELKTEIEEIETGGDAWELAIKDDCKAVIQQKINALMERGNNGNNVRQTD